MASASEVAFRIVRAESGAQFDVACTLFREYAATLETGICLVGFEQELSALPVMYGAPKGSLLLAVSKHDGEALGCAGVRRFDESRAELKRAYTRPHARSLGAGRALTIAAIDCAKSLGYAQLVLDTLDSMVAAQTLYRALGFVECNAYRSASVADAPAAGLRYFSRDL